MNKQEILTSQRLQLYPLSTVDEQFVFELLNTDGWLKFIGNRNISNKADALAYINKIKANENTLYWVVKRKADKEALGIVTLIKRDYLPYQDIGFAFLPRFCKNGYAYEAAHTVLNKLMADENLTHILATTLPENTSSINLLKKLGLQFEKEISVADAKLHLYSASAEMLRAKG